MITPESSLWSYIVIGALAGSLPTISMIATSLASVHVQFTSTFEASAQNYCAGLILGAVAKELFPQLGDAPKNQSFIGLTIGFVIGLTFVNYIDFVATLIEDNLTCCREADGEELNNQNLSAISGSQGEMKELLGGSPTSGPGNVADDSKSYQSIDGDSEEALRLYGGSDAGSDEDHPILLLASQAIASPVHRERIRKKAAELVDSICNIENKADYLHKYVNKTLKLSEAEVFAEQIDEEIHKFQYNLDHCRRLVQGSGSDIEAVVPRIWITDRGISAVRKRLRGLKEGALALGDVLNQDTLSKEALVDIHENMDQMDHYLDQLHLFVEGYSFKWGRRGKKSIIPVPQSGSYIPMSLLVPVTIDCIVDGFLVGSTSAISPQAGVVLGVANMIEMGFLGLAVSVRINKCTGSSSIARYMSLIVPPLIMLAASLLGAVAGSAARAHPIAYTGFISFGIVALLYLVVNELLVEAREAQAGQEYWWTALVLFVGIYSVMLLDMVVTV